MNKYLLVPDEIVSRENETSFEKLRVLGTGAFAQCYLLKKRILENECYYAGKIVAKEDIEKTVANKRNIISEITIHRTINHSNIVEFVEFFEDPHYVYIILELCERRTLSELHKRRPQLSLEETKFYMHQVLQGLEYLHENNIIHRDIKLSNLLITHENCIKIADFGLAVRVTNSGDLRHTLCGTPNYLAPEILLKLGHSFGVDIWAFGCVMYTILAGFAPFEGATIEETFMQIKKGGYKNLKEVLVAPDIDAATASAVVDAALLKNPYQRLNATQLLSMPFFYNPRLVEEAVTASGLINRLVQNLTSFPEEPMQFKAMVDVKVVWVSAWLDYTAKYGFAYRLSDGTTGVLFNDNTSLLNPSGLGLRYVTSSEGFDFESDMIKKQTLFRYFKKDFDRLAQDEESLVDYSDDFDIKSPMLLKWARFESYILFELQDKSVQINYLEEDVKFLIGVKTSTITVVTDFIYHTYGVDELGLFGCDPDFFERLCSILRILLSAKWE